MPSWRDIDTSTPDGGWASCCAAAKIDTKHKEALEKEAEIETLSDFYNVFSTKEGDKNYYEKALEEIHAKTGGKLIQLAKMKTGFQWCRLAVDADNAKGSGSASSRRRRRLWTVSPFRCGFAWRSRRMAPIAPVLD